MKTLLHEDQSGYDRLLASYRSEFQPVTAHEQFLVTQLAESRWRLDRARRLEALAFDHIAAPTEVDETNPDARIVANLGSTAVSTRDRWAAAAEKSYFRAHRQLAQARAAEKRNEANRAQVSLKQQVEPLAPATAISPPPPLQKLKSSPRMPKHIFRRNRPAQAAA